MNITKLLTGMLVASLLICAGCTTPTTDPDFAHLQSGDHHVPAQDAADHLGRNG